MKTLRPSISVLVGIHVIFFLCACQQQPAGTPEEQVSGVFSFEEKGEKHQVHEIILQPKELIYESAMATYAREKAERSFFSFWGKKKSGPLLYGFESPLPGGAPSSMNYFGAYLTILSPEDEVRYFTAICACKDKNGWHIVDKGKTEKLCIDEIERSSEGKYKIEGFYLHTLFEQFPEYHAPIIKEIPPHLYDPFNFYYIVVKSHKRETCIYTLRLYEWTCSSCGSALAFYRVEKREVPLSGEKTSYRVLYVVPVGAMNRFKPFLKKLYGIGDP